MMLKVKFFQFEDYDINLMADALQVYEQKLREDKHALQVKGNYLTDVMPIQCRILEVKRMAAFLLED